MRKRFSRFVILWIMVDTFERILKHSDLRRLVSDGKYMFLMGIYQIEKHVQEDLPGSLIVFLRISGFTLQKTRVVLN